MDELDRYLQNEYQYPEYRRGLLTESASPSPWQRAWALLLGPRSRGPVSDQTVGLSRNRAWVWHVTSSAPNITCTAGRLWLTRTGDSRDYFLGPCESLTLTPGKWVVQSLAPSRFRTRTPNPIQEACYDKTPLLPVLQRV